MNSNLVWECVLLLKYLSTRNNITLVWVPGHNGSKGNEIANSLAKKGAEFSLSCPIPFCGTTMETIKLEVKKWLTKETTNRWHELAEARDLKN